MKSSSVYVCSNCGSESLKWKGQCSGCLEWNTLVETLISKPKGKKSSKAVSSVQVVPLKDVNVGKEKRLKSGISEFDRVLGGGFIPGQVVLLAGEPGIGKSTLLMQVASSFSGAVLYISGEESVSQIAVRANRLGVAGKDIRLVNETNVDDIINILDSTLSLVIVDSIQTLYTEDLTGTSGSVGQVRECAFRLTQMVKKINIPLVIVGHITKGGDIAGPKILEHIVDTVLYLEGDKNHLFRILKGIKNRFGSVDEVGVFEMEGSGMREVKNPSTFFLDERLENVSGSIATISMEGTRPFAVEIQALAVRTSFGYPKRTAFGVSINRVQILCAVLEKRLNLPLSNFDIYVNVSGGLRLNDTALDLAVCLAIYSSVKDTKVSARTLAFGEVGLSGEIRKVPSTEKRIKEASRLGFKNVIGPNTFRSLGMAVRKVSI